MSVWFDKDAIYSNLDARSLIDYLGIRSRKAGSTTYIVCPNPDHIEKSAYRPKHCQLFQDSCYCWSCGATYNLYGIAYNWMEKEEGQHLTGEEVYSILAEAAGGKENYIIKGNKQPKIQRFPLNDKELHALMLTKYPTAKSTISLTEVVEEDGIIIASKEQTNKQISLLSLWKEDKNAFMYIVKTKAKQQLEKNAEMYELFKNSKTIDGQNIAQSFNENIFTLKNLLLKMQ